MADASLIVRQLELTPAQWVGQVQGVLSNMWVIRTFLKRSEEAEEVLELREVPRAIFDAVRAIETKADDPPKFLRFIKKKMSKLRQARQLLSELVESELEHTNFEQSLLALTFCLDELDQWIHAAEGFDWGSFKPALETSDADPDADADLGQ